MPLPPERRLRSGLLRALAVFAVAVPAVASAEPTVHVELSTIKIGPTYVQPVPPSLKASLTAARNEFEAFQILVTAGNRAITIDSLTLSSLTSRNASALPIATTNFRLYRVDTVQVGKVSGLEGRLGEYPDILRPAYSSGLAWDPGAGSLISSSETRGTFPMSLQNAQRVVLWVELHVPNDPSVFGAYDGTFVLTYQEEGAKPETLEVNVGLEVLDFFLPATSSMPAFSQVALDNLCNAHGEQAGSVRCMQINRLYATFMLDHRISIGLWQTTPSSVEYLNQYETLISGLTSADGAILDGAAVTALQYPWYKELGVGEDEAIWEQGEKDKIERWWNDVIAPAPNVDRSEISFAFVPKNDEPHAKVDDDPSIWERVDDRGRLFHEAAPGLRVLLTTDIRSFNSARLPLPGVGNVRPISPDRVDVFASIVQLLDAKQGAADVRYFGDQIDSYAAFLARGGTSLWGYQSCYSHSCGKDKEDESLEALTGWPNLTVDAPGISARAQPWLHFIYRVSGLYYYDSAAWNLAETKKGKARPDNVVDPTIPMKEWDIWNTEALGNGDGILVYPGRRAEIGGTTDIPLASYRLKMLRDGLEDFEYLKLCASINETRAREIANFVFAMTDRLPAGNGNPERPTGAMFGVYDHHDPGSAVSQAHRIEAARRALAGCIVGLPHPSVGNNLSPVIIQEPHACENAVVVRGFTPGSTLKIQISGDPVITVANARDSDGAFIPVSSPLQEGQVIVAWSIHRGIESAFSSATVLPIPSTLLRPIVLGPLWECGEGLMVGRGSLGGMEVEIERDGSLLSTTHLDAARSDFQWIETPRLMEGDEVRARNFACQQVTPTLPPVVVDVAPVDPLVPPMLDLLYENGPKYLPSRTYSGALFTMKRSTEFSEFRVPGISWYQSTRNPKFLLRGETLVASQRLCSDRPPVPVSASVRNCEEVPSATLTNPVAGTEILEFTSTIAGTTITVEDEDSGVVVANGGGSKVQTLRPLVAGHWLRITQSMEVCSSGGTSRIQVGPSP